MDELPEPLPEEPQGSWQERLMVFAMLLGAAVVIVLVFWVVTLLSRHAVTQPR